MVLVALYAFIKKAKPAGLGIVYPGNLGDFIALAAFMGLVIYLYLKARK